jgi:hypothetical protein
MKSLLFLAALTVAHAEPVKDPPKVEITAISEEPFTVKPEEKDPFKTYTEDFYGWRYVTASVLSRVTGDARTETIWAIKGTETGTIFWTHGGEGSVSFEAGKTTLLKAFAPQITNRPAYLASDDAKKEEPWTNAGWVVCVMDKAGKILAVKGSTSALVESYRKTHDAMQRQDKRK